ncbi:MAG: YqiA/YcfP family alpha/beta fold hydrolase, partial [bacterium]|nr:YqiA/YcfP family alpha/beta fold hydrolase [bacterium]
VISTLPELRFRRLAKTMSFWYISYMEMEKVTFKNAQGLNIVGVLHWPNSSPPYPLVVYFHGFGGTKESGKDFSQILNLLEIATFCIDFQGSGESEGRYEDKTITGFLDDAQSAIDYVYSLPKVNKSKIGITGHSIGAAVATLQAARDSRITALAVSSPAVKTGEAIANLYEQNDFKMAQEKGHVELMKYGERKRLNYTFFEDAERYDVAKEASSIPYAFLVIGAKQDSVVPFKQIEGFSESIKNAQLLVLPRSDHNLKKEWPLVEKAFSSWFSQWLQGLT